MQAPLIGTTQQAKPNAEIQLEQIAHKLAGNHTAIESHMDKVYLLGYLKSWKRTLQDSYACFRSAPSKDIAFSQAAEWMLDNFYIVEQTQHQIEQDLPKRYFDQLPKLRETALKGYPRIFALGWEWVRYNQCQLDLAQTSSFLQDYQQVSPLTIGELWALPTMLRIGILERLATAVAVLTGIDEPEILQDSPSIPSSPTISNETIVANCFLGLRLLSATDWKIFFEKISRVEKIYATIQREFIQAWILTPAIAIEVLLKNWHAIQSKTRKRLRELQLNLRVMRKKNHRLSIETPIENHMLVFI